MFREGRQFFNYCVFLPLLNNMLSNNQIVRYTGSDNLLIVTLTPVRRDWG